jgi:hypothetical protein
VQYYITKEKIMRTIANTEHITIAVSNDELINEKWLNLNLLSKKLRDVEREKGLSYKKLCNKLYNSVSCDKYNMTVIAGLKCIDVTNPMRANTKASIEFDFKRG